MLRSLFALVFAQSHRLVQSAYDENGHNQTFVSRPDIVAPVLKELHPAIEGSLAEGLVFLTPHGSGPGFFAPVIVSPESGLVWSGWDAPHVQGPDSAPGAVGDWDVTDFCVQSYNGSDVLVYWTGFITHLGCGFGSTTILNTNYEEIAHITLEGSDLMGYGNYSSHVDLHEHQLTDEGTILVSGYSLRQQDLSSLGGPKDGYLLDSAAYEINISTNAILFEWHAADHMDVLELNKTHYPIEDRGTSVSNPFDFFHLNSVQKVDGFYYINSRHYWSVFKVSSNGTIVWTLEGGDGGDFELVDKSISFSWQHHVRLHPENRLTIFDNGNYEAGVHANLSRGYELVLDESKMTADLGIRLTNSYRHIYAYAQGSYDDLPNGNKFIGYGAVGRLTEFLPDGSVGYDVVYTEPSGAPSHSYRAFKQVWEGHPRTGIDLVLEVSMDRSGLIDAYMSWNGATNVAYWDIYAGNTSEHMSVIDSVNSTGFETHTTLFPATYVYVSAMSVNQTTLGKSSTQIHSYELTK